MEEKLVDARGQLCPRPLIMTKKALKESSPGTRLLILIDNETSKQNVERFLVDNAVPFTTISNEPGVFAISVGTISAELAHPDAESYCTPATPMQKAGQHAIVIRSDKMGQGADDLGSILIKAFINTIGEIAPLPETIVFYNSAILLTIDGSPVLDSLRELASRGVNILVCGTCADYYQKKSEVRVGTISNMYSILEALTSARSIISP